MTKYGTSYFPTRGNAIRYYRAYENDPAAAVERKLKAGEIHIGKPPTKPGDVLTIEDCRYHVTEGPQQLETMADDYGFESPEIRVLPIGGGGNILCGRRGYLREMAFRRERNAAKAGPMAVANPFDTPAWEDLEIYWPKPEDRR